MTGTMIPVLERTDFSFTTTVAGTMAEVPIAPNIDVSQYTDCQLLLRIHALSIANPGSTIALRARRVAPTEEDPAQFFRDTSTAWTVTAGTNDLAPRILSVNVGPNAGGWISIFLVVTQGSAGTTLTATLSAELVLKDGD